MAALPCRAAGPHYNGADMERPAPRVTVPSATRPVLAALLATLAGLAAPHAAEPPDIELVAYLPDLGAEISAAEVRAQIALYADFLAEQGIAKARITVVESVKELEDFVAKRPAGKPTLGVLHPLVAMLMQESWGLTPVAVPVQQGKSTAPRVVVTQRGSTIKSLADLRGKSLVITRPWDQLPDLLGLMLFGKAERADQAVTLMLAETSAQAVVAVLGRKADAAMVSSYVFRVSAKSDRRTWQALAEVGETPPTHLSCVVSFAGTPSELAESVGKALLTAKESDAGTKILDGFRLDGFERATVESLSAVEGKLLAQLPGTAGGPAGAAPATGLESIEAERRGADVGITMKLPAPLAEGESASLRYTVDGSPEASVVLRCLTQTCTAMIPAEAGEKISLHVTLSKGGTEHALGAAELVAP